MNFLIAVGGCLMAVIGTGFVAVFLFGGLFPDVEWPEEDEQLWPAP